MHVQLGALNVESWPHDRQHVDEALSPTNVPELRGTGSSEISEGVVSTQQQCIADDNAACCEQLTSFFLSSSPSRLLLLAVQRLRALLREGCLARQEWLMRGT